MTEKEIFEDIVEASERLFGFQLIKSEPIRRGHLNLKWKIETTDGTSLLKQYNKSRLKKYSTSELRKAFQLQNDLHQQGFPCPQIHSSQGELFFQSPRGEHFIVMDYCSGNTVGAGKLSESQMFDLGYNTGKMHSILNKAFRVSAAKTTFQPPTREERRAYWQSVLQEVHEQGKNHLADIFEKQLELLIHVNPADFITPYTGWCHRDLWVDNLLFHPNKLSAIIDFDRIKPDYLALDVGRAVISGALDGDELKVACALAFLEGYRHFHQVEADFLTKSLQLLWYMESTWWLEPDMDEHSGPPKRFIQEMIWLSDHLMELEDILGGY